MNLYEALRKPERSRIAFVGSGGKTTALFQLARLMAPPTIVTCSTHLGAWQVVNADSHYVIEHPGEVKEHASNVYGVTLFTGPKGEDNRFRGVDAQSLAELKDLSTRLGCSLLIEADGSRQHPLKAPNENEPVIPDWVDQVILIAGLSGLGKPLTHEYVHRPEIFSRLSGQAVNEIVNEEGIARVLGHSEGGLKNIPASAKKVLVLNQADYPALEINGLRVANKVKTHFSRVIIASLIEKKVFRVVEPSAGIILAGGGSSRYGKPKMLLPWGDSTIIRHISGIALEARLNPVIIVLGAVQQEIRQAVTGLPVIFTENHDWRSGQSSSVKMGLQAAPTETGAAMFLLSDQPQITVDLISGLIDKHQTTLSPVIAPRINGQRANPVIFDRITFEALMGLTGDVGGRAIFPQYPPSYLEWVDEKIMLDIDTPDDYEDLRDYASG